MHEYKVPLKLVDVMEAGYHAHIEVVVNGIPTTLVVDSGASHTAFDQQYLEDLIGIIPLDQNDQKSSGIGSNNLVSYQGTISTFQIGEFIEEDFQVAILDLSAINIAYQQAELDPVLGVLGCEFLLKHRAILDFDAMEIIFKGKEK